MGHITSKNAYKSLEERINWFTQGAPASETFYKILQVLFTEKEARVMSMLPVRPFTIKRAARIWNTSEAKAEKVLDQLCEKALLVDSTHNGVRKFVIPPPMAGFIEFALMRTRGDIDQKYLSELYYQYMNVEEDFVKDLFYATETKLGRVYVQEPVLTNEHTNHILDYERASHIIEEAEYIGLGLCYCRHKAYHAGHPCEIDAPWDVCLTFGNVARSLAEHGGHARLISKEEAIKSTAEMSEKYIDAVQEFQESQGMQTTVGVSMNEGTQSIGSNGIQTDANALDATAISARDTGAVDSGVSGGGIGDDDFGGVDNDGDGVDDGMDI